MSIISDTIRLLKFLSTSKISTLS